MNVALPNALVPHHEALASTECSSFASQISSKDSEPVVCIVHPDSDVSRSIAETLETRLGIRPRTYTGIPNENVDYDEHRLACVIAAFHVNNFTGSEVLAELKRSGLDARVVLIGAGKITIRQAVDAMQNGAVHVLEQPLDEHELVHAVQEAIHEPEAHPDLLRSDATLSTE